MNNREPKMILTVAGSDSGGGAGIQADIKTIAALGGYGMSVITALTAQNTLGVSGIYETPPDFIASQFDAVATDMGIDAMKTGMLATSGAVRVVAAKIREYQIGKVVVDPVMVAKGGASLVMSGAVDALIQELIPLALLITPNIPEAEALVSASISSVDDMKMAAKKIRELGVKNVVIKGGHLKGASTDVLYDGLEFFEFVAERIDTQNTHGTGCTFSAAIAAILAQGASIVEAVGKAKQYVTEAIRHSYSIGKGHGPLNHFAVLSPKPEFDLAGKYNQIV